MSISILVDTTKCIGCRACQVACKGWNQLSAERTQIEGHSNGYENPPRLSASTLTLIAYSEVDAPGSPGGLKRIFSKRQCMHCQEPACVSACPVTALHKTKEGPVIYDDKKCIGCRYCVWACPFGVPTAQWDSLAPRIRKCTLCFDRVTGGRAPSELNGQALSGEQKTSMDKSLGTPACAKVCTTGALKFGDRDALLAEARERIQSGKGRYVPHIYGEKEVGGTGYLYLSSVPFEKLGFRTDLGERSYPSYSSSAIAAVGPAVFGLGAFLTATYLITKRRLDVKASENADTEGVDHGTRNR